MTQRDLILNHLRTHESITPMEAFSQYGITKLATVISEMIRHEGMNIHKELVKSKNRYGRPTAYMKYSLIENGEKNGH